MGEIIAAVVGLILAFYGVVDLVGRLCCRILFSGGEKSETLTLWAEGNTAEYRVRRLSAWRWVLPPKSVELAVVTDDPETARLCEEVSLAHYTKKEWEKLCETALQDENSTL